MLSYVKWFGCAALHVQTKQNRKPLEKKIKTMSMRRGFCWTHYMHATMNKVPSMRPSFVEKSVGVN